MKKIIILLAASLVAAGAYAQTQRTNRTKVRTHDRNETVSGTNAQTEQDKKNRPDRMRHENDMDRNNTNNNTNNVNRSNTNTNTNGTNTNGGSGNNGSNINTNNPK